MSQINTRILRVPGTTSGQIDERAIGSFSAPMEAAGKAMASLGELGQEIALRDQRIDDEKASAKIMNEAFLLEQQYSAWAAEADTQERVDELSNGLQEAYVTLGKRAEGIGSDQLKQQVESKLSLSGSKQMIGLGNRGRQINISDTRLEVGMLIETIAKQGIVTGNVEAARAEIRRIVEGSEGTSFSKAEIESVIRNATNPMDLQSAAIKVASGEEDINFEDYDSLTTGQLGSLIAHQTAERVRDGKAADSSFLSELPALASDAAMGVYEGKAIGSSEKALGLIQDKIKGMALDDVEQQKALRVAEEVFTASQSMRQIAVAADFEDIGTLDALTESFDSLIAKSEDEGKPYLANTYRKAREMASRQSQAILQDRLLLDKKVREGMARGFREDASFLREEAYRQARSGTAPTKESLKAAMEGRTDYSFDKYPNGKSHFLDLEEQVIPAILQQYQELQDNALDLAGVKSRLVYGKGSAMDKYIHIAGEYYVNRSDEGVDFSPLEAALLNPQDEESGPLLMALAKKQKGSEYPAAFNDYVRQANDLQGEEKHKLFEALYAAHTNPVVKFSPDKMDDMVLSSLADFELKRYFKERSAGGSPKEAFGISLQLADIKERKEFMREYSSGIGDSSDFLTASILSSLGVEGKDELLEQMTKDLGGGLEARAFAASVESSLYDTMNFFAAREGVNPFRPDQTTTEQRRRVYQKSLSYLSGTMGQTSYPMERRRKSNEDSGITMFSGWTVESEYGLTRHDGSVNHEVIMKEASSTLKFMLNNELVVETLRESGVDVDGLAYVVESSEEFVNADPEQLGFLTGIPRGRGGAIDEKALQKAMASPLAPRVFRKNQLGDEPSYTTRRHYSPDIFSYNLVANPVERISDEENENLNALARASAAAFGGRPIIQEMPFRHKVEFGFVGEDNEPVLYPKGHALAGQQITIKIAPSADSYLYSKMFAQEMYVEKGQTVFETAFQNAAGFLESAFGKKRGGTRHAAPNFNEENR